MSNADFATAPGRVTTRHTSRPLDLPALMALLQRRWPALLAMTLVVPLLVYIGSLFLAPSFSSTAQIQVNPAQRAVPTGDAQTAASGLPDQGLVDTEVSILRSRDVAGAVVDRLGLAHVHEFADPKPKLFAAPARPLTPAEHREVAIATVLDHLDTKREGVSYVVDVTAHSRDPKLAAAIANAFADAYIQNNIDTRVQSAGRQSQWLDQRLNTLANAAETADADVARYKAAHNLATIGGGANGATVNDQQIAPLSTELATADSDAAAARAKYQAAIGQASRGRAGSLSSVLTSPLITELQAQRTQVLRNVAEVDQRYGPLHPETARVHQQLADVDRAIAAESQRIVASLHTDSQAADARAASLRGQLGALRGVAAGDEQAGVQADALQRRADSARLIYTQFAQAAQQLGQERQSREPTARLFNRAEPSGAPAFPNRKLLVALGLVVGFITGVALIVVLEALDGAVRTVDDVERGLDERLAACLPRMPGGARATPKRAFDAVVDQAGGRYAEGVRALRSSVVLAGRGEAGGRVLAVTSPSSPEETAGAAALARSLALAGRRVLFIDAQLRGDGAALVQGQGKASLPEVLAGRQALEHALAVDKASGLAVLTLDAKGRDLLTGPEMQDMLRALRTHFDWVVVETPPILGSADARTLCAEADQVLVMAEWGRTRREAAEAALTRLDNDRAPVMGLALVNVNTTAPHALGPGAEAYFARRVAA